jgi:hypothetical protein
MKKYCQLRYSLIPGSGDILSPVIKNLIIGKKNRLMVKFLETGDNLSPVTKNTGDKMVVQLSVNLHLEINVSENSNYNCTVYCNTISSKQNMETFSVSKFFSLIAGVVDTGN